MNDLCATFVADFNGNRLRVLVADVPCVRSTSLPVFGMLCYTRTLQSLSVLVFLSFGCSQNIQCFQTFNDSFLQTFVIT